jgi:hypothetical protein
MVAPVCERDHQGYLQKSTPGSESSALLLPEASTIFNTGGCCRLNGSNVHGSWTEKQKSSTWRELEAIHRMLRSNFAQK